MYPFQRNLDGVYFRVVRDGKWCNVCFSDMTESEREYLRDMKTEQLTLDQQVQWWYHLACICADSLHDVGDEFDIRCVEGDDE